MSEPCAQCDNQPCLFEEFREDFIETKEETSDANVEH